MTRDKIIVVLLFQLQPLYTFTDKATLCFAPTKAQAHKRKTKKKFSYRLSPVICAVVCCCRQSLQNNITLAVGIGAISKQAKHKECDGKVKKCIKYHS